MNFNKNGYLLLFTGTESYKQLPLEEMQQLIAKNNAWFERLAAEGKIAAAQPLARRGVTVGRQGRVISDGPFAESKEAVGGYLLLKSETLEEAVAIAKTCPSLDYGTVVDVRPVTDTCPLTERARELEKALELTAA